MGFAPPLQDMPRITTLDSVALYLHYREDGEEPHVHARYQNRETRFSLSTGQVMDARSNLEPSQRRRVRAWIGDHRSELLTIWATYRRGQRDREVSGEKT